LNATHCSLITHCRSCYASKIVLQPIRFLSNHSHAFISLTSLCFFKEPQHRRPLNATDWVFLIQTSYLCHSHARTSDRCGVRLVIAAEKQQHREAQELDSLSEFVYYSFFYSTCLSTSTHSCGIAAILKTFDSRGAGAFLMSF
jgi:hypothetical protein